MDDGEAHVCKAQRLAWLVCVLAAAAAVRVHVLTLPPCPPDRFRQPQAGEEVTVYYNPNNSVLPGREKIFIKCGKGLAHCTGGGVAAAGEPLLVPASIVAAAVAAVLPLLQAPGRIYCVLPGLHCKPAAPHITHVCLDRRGGWNRWRHPRGFGPLEMTPPKEGDHFQVGCGRGGSSRCKPCMLAVTGMLRLLG